MKATLYDYGAGNLHSLGKALVRAGVEVEIETEAQRCLEAELLVLPGVGAFSPAAATLDPARSALRDALTRGMPCLGVCLGMQLLFDRSEEGPGTGLGVFEGDVTRLRSARTPHIGWNTLEDIADPALGQTRDVYYAHSFACRPRDEACVVAWSEIEGDRFPAAVRRGKILGVQFHPEKSSLQGLQLIEAFVREVS